MQKRKLREVGTIISGATPNTTDSTNFGGDIPWITPADLSGYTEKYIAGGARNLTEKGYNSCSTQLMPANSVVFSSRAPIGYVAIAKNPLCTNQGFKSVIPDDGLDSEFLYYQLLYLRDSIREMGTGTTFKEISGKRFGEIDIAVPSIYEQRRIVARIEELFSQLDDAEATLQKTKAQLALYRQAVLKEAFQGKEQWDKYTFNDLLSGMRNGYGEKPTDSGDYKILRISAVRPLVLNLSDYRMNQGAFTEENLIQENDLLFTRYNGSQEYVGVCARVPSLDDDYAYPDKIIRCRLKQPGTILAKYLMYYLNSGDARKYIRSRIKTTSGQKGIAGGDIKRTTVYLPDGQKKKEIIDYIESRLSFCESIGQTVEDSILQIQALRRSILKQAFRGELQNEGI